MASLEYPWHVLLLADLELDLRLCNMNLREIRRKEAPLTGGLATGLGTGVWQPDQQAELFCLQKLCFCNVYTFYYCQYHFKSIHHVYSLLLK